MTWLRDLIDKLTSIFPRLVTVDPDESGVRVTLGKYVRAVNPGWYIIWPVIQEITVVTVTPQVVDLRPQSVIVGGEDKCVSGAVQYRIRDAEKAILKVQNFDESLQALALGVICTHAATIADAPGVLVVEDLRNAVLRGIKESARGWGLDVMKVFVTDVGSVKNIRLLTNVPSMPNIVIAGDE